MLSRLAPAKVNLGLNVLRRRLDGYHEIETVFAPIGWSDRLSAEPWQELALSTSDPELPTDNRNLVWQAAEALAAWAKVPPCARLHLDKRVPYGAGLGSGSSDAAAALRLCAELWDLHVPEATLLRLGSALGADVPFFLRSGAALGTGLGDTLHPLSRADGTAWACPFSLVVVVPDVHVSTAEAYRLVSPDDHDRQDLTSAITSNDLARWHREVTNDFEAPIVEQHPEVARALERLREAGAGWAALSGSGSAVVGAFEDPTEAAVAAREAKASEARVWVEPPRTT
ncbi:MAG: 4-(cytidine 5'-diphospho)-2-C-methyl-D-erythritol kinase [Bacteroidota bacterium]